MPMPLFAPKRSRSLVGVSFFGDLWSIVFALLLSRPVRPTAVSLKLPSENLQFEMSMQGNRHQVTVFLPILSSRLVSVFDKLRLRVPSLCSRSLASRSCSLLVLSFFLNDSRCPPSMCLDLPRSRS